MTVPVQWGLMSTAAINDWILEGCAGSPEVQFSAIGSRSLEKARSFAERHGIARAYGSYEQLLADPGIDAVYISLPNSMHVEWSIRALEAGKHVLCEKPLSRRPDQVALAFDASRRSQRLLVEAFMWRFHPQTTRIRELMELGTIGAAQFVRATLSFSLTPFEMDVRSSLDLDGGALMDVGCYGVSAFRLFAGEPTVVAAQVSRAPSGVDMRMAGTLVAEDGVVGQFDCGMDLPPRKQLEIVGTDGTITVPDPWHCRAEQFELRIGDRRESISVPVRDPYRVQFEVVSRAIRGGPVPEFAGEDAIAQAAALQALHRSGEAAMPVSLVPDSMV